MTQAPGQISNVVLLDLCENYNIELYNKFNVG